MPPSTGARGAPAHSVPVLTRGGLDPIVRRPLATITFQIARPDALPGLVRGARVQGTCHEPSRLSRLPLFPRPRCLLGFTDYGVCGAGGLRRSADTASGRG